jgi:SH3 domain protein
MSSQKASLWGGISGKLPHFNNSGKDSKNMKIFRFIVPVTLGLSLVGQLSWAEKAYVTDSFEITLRSGPSVQNKIISLLRSNQPLEILESQDNWSHVRLPEREQEEAEGWVLSRYLVTRQPWKIQAESLKEENSQLKENLARVEKEWGEAAQNEQDLSKEVKKYTQSLRKLQNEYQALKEGATEYLKVKQAYDDISAALETSQKAVQRLTKENERLRSSERNKWFGMGALVLLSGLVLGSVIGRQEKKRKSLLYE